MNWYLKAIAATGNCDSSISNFLSLASPALFSILGPLHGMSFLDLFSGTGRVAAEARKRGASIVTVELVRERASAIRRTLGDTSHIQLCMDVRRALNWCEKPYANTLFKEL